MDAQVGQSSLLENASLTNKSAGTTACNATSSGHDTTNNNNNNNNNNTSTDTKSGGCGNVCHDAGGCKRRRPCPPLDATGQLATVSTVCAQSLDLKYHPLGTVVYKYFEPKWYFGHVANIDTKYKLYGIIYEDGDREELSPDEIDSLVMTFFQNNNGETLTAKIPVTLAKSDSCCSTTREWNKNDGAVRMHFVKAPGTTAICDNETFHTLDRNVVKQYIQKRQHEQRQQQQQQKAAAAPKLPPVLAKRRKLNPANAATTALSPKPISVDCCYDTNTGQLTEHICNFFRFVHERQMIWYRRNKNEYLVSNENLSNGNDPDDNNVLTHDVILQQFHFCNVYRELDRGTAFFHNHILDLWDVQCRSDRKWDRDDDDDHDDDGHEHCRELEWLATVLWAACVYRMVNRVETFVALGIPTLDQADDFIRRAKIYSKSQVAFFTGAHNCPNLATFLDNIRHLYRSNGRQLHEKVTALMAAKDTKECLIILQTISGVAHFLSWQIFCDLQESGCLQQFSCGKDNFCRLGPGAQKGIDLIFPNANRLDYLEHALTLVKVQHKAFAQIQVKFKPWQNQMLKIKEMEHALCEYSKYVKQKKIQENMRFQKTRIRWFKSQSIMDVDKPCHICKSVKEYGTICDTCNQFYCADCVHDNHPAPPPADDAEWTCPRCIDFEATFSLRTNKE